MNSQLRCFDLGIRTSATLFCPVTASGISTSHTGPLSNLEEFALGIKFWTILFPFCKVKDAAAKYTVVSISSSPEGYLTPIDTDVSYAYV